MILKFEINFSIYSEGGKLKKMETVGYDVYIGL